MGGFLGYQRHYPNPRTRSQVRTSEAGGKFMDDHFQGIFLGGSLKKATASSTITAATTDGDGNIIMGTGTVTLYTITSDVVEGPPYMTHEELVTVYNPNSVVYFTGDNVPVVDTGRFFVIEPLTRTPQNGVGSGTMTRTVFSDGNSHTLSTTEAIGGASIWTNVSSDTCTFPDADDLVAAIPGCQVGTFFKHLVAVTNSGTLTVVEGSGGTPMGVHPLNGDVAKEYTVLFTNVTAASEAYDLIEVSEES